MALPRAVIDGPLKTDVLAPPEKIERATPQSGPKSDIGPSPVRADIASLDNRLKSEDESAFELVSNSPVAPPRIRASPKLSAGQHPRRI